MGIKESSPVIRGKSINLETKEEKDYFNRSKIILKKDYLNNMYSNYNLIKSFEIKSFVFGTRKEEKINVRDMTYIEYLIIHINSLHEKYHHPPWTNELLIQLKKQKINNPENKYFSDFFYNEYQIKTMPRIINEENEKIEKTLRNNYSDFPLFSTELTMITENNNDNHYSELDVIDNLGGSFLEINYDEFSPDDPTFRYQQRRNDVKKYIKVFKEHIYNNKDHPLYQIISSFNRLFSKYIEDKIKELKNQLEKEIINQERYDTSIKNLEKEITDSLQEFISRMHSAVKLFYSTTIDYNCFENEKDDLINLVTSLFFKVGNLYESLLSLYSISFKDEFQNFQDKLIYLKKVKPKDLGIEIKFCLDEETIKLKNKLKFTQIDKKNEKNENAKVGHEKKKSGLFQKIRDENKGNMLFPINERDEENSEINIEEGSINKQDGGNLVFYITGNNDHNNDDDNDIRRFPTDMNLRKKSQYKFNKKKSNSEDNINKKNKNNNNDNNIDNDNKEDDYLLERVSLLEDSKNDFIINPIYQMRNSVNNFNNKIYFFPKLHEQLKKNINSNESKKKKNSKYNIDDDLPIPYYSAIRLMKSIKKYKTPFEKIILIAAISDQITECASSFWKGMENYIEKDFLFIEADEIMSIFLYIMIQSQMPEMILFCKIINNFTTQFTKGFSISYNYTLLEASMDYIKDVKDIKELSQKENGLIEVRNSILDLSTQRLSRISMGRIKN
jgi:hypothetical protein